MNKISKIWLLGMVAAGLALGMATKEVRAVDGTAELRNVKGDRARCVAATALMVDFKHQILLSCRDLIYPVDVNVFHYALWVRSLEDGSSVLVGEVGEGKGLYSTKEDFTSLFVTAEYIKKPKEPSDMLIMSGEVVPFGLLTEVSANEVESTPTPQVQASPRAETTTVIETAPNTEVRVPGRFSIFRLIFGILIGVVVFVVIVALLSALRRRPIE